MIDFEWIPCYKQMPDKDCVILATDGTNIVIMDYKYGIFYPIRTVDIHSKLNIIPKYWYNLNDVRLPEE